MNKCGLWKYNKVTGMWVLQRTCENENNAHQWLMIFSDDDPDEHFCIAREGGKPKIIPATDNVFGVHLKTVH